MKLIEKLEMERIVAREFINSLLNGFSSFDIEANTLTTRWALLILSHALDCAHKFTDEAGEFEHMTSPARALINAHNYIEAIGDALHNLIDRDPNPDNVPMNTRDKWHKEIRDAFLERLIIANKLANNGEVIVDSDGDACSPPYAAYDALSNSLKYQYKDEEIGFTEFMAKREYLLDLYKICFLRANS